MILWGKALGTDKQSGRSAKTSLAGFDLVWWADRSASLSDKPSRF